MVGLGCLEDQSPDSDIGIGGDGGRLSPESDDPSPLPLDSLLL